MRTHWGDWWPRQLKLLWMSTVFNVCQHDSSSSYVSPASNQINTELHRTRWCWTQSDQRSQIPITSKCVSHPARKYHFMGILLSKHCKSTVLIIWTDQVVCPWRTLKGSKHLHNVKTAIIKLQKKPPAVTQYLLFLSTKKPKVTLQIAADSQGFVCSSQDYYIPYSPVYTTGPLSDTLVTISRIKKWMFSILKKGPVLLFVFFYKNGYTFILCLSHYRINVIPVRSCYRLKIWWHASTDLLSRCGKLAELFWIAFLALNCWNSYHVSNAHLGLDAT